MSMLWPALHSPVFKTPNGIPYLKTPGVVLVAQPAFNGENLKGFLEGFDESLKFRDYLLDPQTLPDAEGLCKFAGQLCYLSFGPSRTWNSDASGYFRNIKTSGHGSVLEHANFSFLCYGIDRSVTHDLVRHRAGFGFSQVSQRYVDDTKLRFVERVECQGDPLLHEAFLLWCESSALQYQHRQKRLRELHRQRPLTGLSKTDIRKAINQVARGCLPNEVEAPILVTANVRGWRHFCEQRASSHADSAIRALGVQTMLCLKKVAPRLFDDYSMVPLVDESMAVQTDTRKV